MLIADLIVGAGLGLRHHTDTRQNTPAVDPVTLTFGVPAGFYGRAIYKIQFGNMNAGVVQMRATQLNYADSIIEIHPQVISEGIDLWSWIEQGRNLILTFTSLTGLAEFLQFTLHEIYFPKQENMEAAKLAIWGQLSKDAYREATKRKIVSPLFGIGDLR